MATIGEIVQAASYRGDPSLGPGFSPAVTIDPSPLQRLSTFTYYRDQARWQQKQIDDATAAKQIADIAAYDITSPLTPYSDALKSELQDIQKYIRENPDALVYSRSPEKFTDLNKRLNRFNTLRKSGTASDVVYNARKAKIDTEPDPNRKAVMQAELDLDVKDLFDGGVDVAVNKVLRTAPDLKPDDYKIPDVAIRSYDVISSTPNADIITNFKLTDIDKLYSDAALAVAGNKTLDENAAWFKALSPERQDLERKKFAVTSLQREQLAKRSADFNAFKAQWEAANPGVDITTIQGAPSGKDTMLDIIKSVNGYNAQINEVNGLISAGKYKDPTGKIITRQYPGINIKDGLSEDEIVVLNALQKSGNSIWSLDKKIQQTDNAFQNAQLGETIRHNKAGEANDRAQLKLNEDKWKTSQTGGETVKNGVLERAKRIYADLQKLTDKNGVISPDKVRRLNSEQLKYLGTEEVTESDSGVPRSIFKPLDLSNKDKNGEKVHDGYAIQLINGEIKVLRNASLAENGSGIYVGQWDNTKSTNVFNVGTNILNEELSKAGTKELNSYMSIDMGNPQQSVTTNTTGGTTTQQGSASTPVVIETYTTAELKGAGWTDAQIKEAVRIKKIKIK